MNILQKRYETLLNDFTEAFQNEEHRFSMWTMYTPEELWKTGFFVKEVIDKILEGVSEKDIDEFIDLNKENVMEFSALKLKIDDSEQEGDIKLSRMLFIVKSGIAISFVVSELSKLIMRKKSEKETNGRGGYEE